MPCHSAPSKAITYYLLAYNTASFLAWLAIFGLLIAHVFFPSFLPSAASASTASKLASSSPSKIWSSLFGATAPAASKHAFVSQRLGNAYAAVGPLTRIVQLGAILEVVHAALGLVRSPVATTAAQVASRVWTVWAVVEHSPAVSTTYPFLRCAKVASLFD